MRPEQLEYWGAEGGYFARVTELSGYLYQFGKDERRTKLVEALEGFQPTRRDLYLPTNPECRVLGHIPASGACMQSAAKVPILVAFNVERDVDGGDGSGSGGGAIVEEEEEEQGERGVHLQGRRRHPPGRARHPGHHAAARRL